ncbi:MAG: hypothetical protein RLY20_2702 [Verrucomicrobiota bacterium]|jgi:uncharacterized protein YwqG
MTNQEQLENLIAKHKLDRVAAEILQRARPAIRLRKQPRTGAIAGKRRFFGLLPGKPVKVESPAPTALGESRLGGKPDVGPGFSWPSWKGKPLGFLCQINCAEVAALDPEKLWPSTGWLCFFYAIQECPWGGSTDDVDSWSVIQIAPEQARPAVLPSGMDEGSLLPAWPITLELFSSLPGGLGCEMNDQEFESNFELQAELKGSANRAEAAHQLLGHADTVQGPVQDEWEEFQALMKRPSDDSEWKLLLQFDSDNDLNVMWGDAGMLYFGIRKSDFLARRFDETQMIMQCC